MPVFGHLAKLKSGLRLTFGTHFLGEWFSFDQPLEQWLTGEKRGEDQNTKI